MNTQSSLLGSPTARDVAIFVPAREFELSLRFYRELGWQENWRHSGLAQLELAGQRFLLQDYYARKWAENFMMYITVDDAEAWFHHASKLVEGGEFAEARATPPKNEPHGAIVTHVWDPCGVLLHFAQPDQNAAKDPAKTG